MLKFQYALAALSIVLGCAGLAYMGPDHEPISTVSHSAVTLGEATSVDGVLPPYVLPYKEDERMAAIIHAYATFPACEYEDSANCAWDASKRGNGVGRSFVDIGGTAYYLDEVR